MVMSVPVLKQANRLLGTGLLATAFALLPVASAQAADPVKGAQPVTAAGQAATKAPMKAGAKAASGTPADTRMASTAGQFASLPTALGRIVAQLAKVDGNVLVSTQSGLVAGVPGMPLRQGMRVMTTTNSTGVIAFADGCEVTLAPVQRTGINSELTCAERMAAAQGLVLDQAALLAALGGSTESIALAAAGGLGGAGGTAAAVGGLSGVTAIVAAQGDGTVSPN